MSNVLCVSWYDNGQQLQCIAEAMRKYTEHDAIHVNIKPSYLDYDADVQLPPIDDYVKTTELANQVSDCDFFIFSEIFPSDVKNTLTRLRVYNKINPTNTIIRVGGTYVRNRAAEYHMSWIRDNWIFAGIHHDWSLISKVGRLLSLPSICPIDKMPEPAHPENGVRIAFSPTKKEKGVKEFNKVIKLIEKEYNHVEGVPIIGKTWKESVSTKSQCQITFDQFMIPTYGNTAIEGMYLKHVVISNISDYTKFCYPDLPIISVKSEKAMYNELKNVIEHIDVTKEIGKRGRDFVLKYHSPMVVATKLNCLVKHVQSI